MKQLSIWTRSLLLLCFIVFCSSNGWAWSNFALTGEFSGWVPISLTKVNDNHFTGTIDASSWNNPTYGFKFYNKEGDTEKWWGTTSQNIDFTSNSTCTIDEEFDNGNMTWKHNDAYSSYTVDAEYKDNHYWHVTITGVPVTPTPTPTPTPSNTDYAYYLIGNLMDTDGNTINTSDRKFRFFKNTDGTYYFDVPATLTVKSQIVAVAPNGTSNIYGPSSYTEFNITN